MTSTCKKCQKEIPDGKELCEECMQKEITPDLTEEIKDPSSPQKDPVLKDPPEEKKEVNPVPLTPGSDLHDLSTLVQSGKINLSQSGSQNTTQAIITETTHNNYYYGTKNQGNETDKENTPRPPFRTTSVLPDEIDKVKRLFVNPQGFQERTENLLKQKGVERVIMLSGQAHSGKYFASIHLALKLCEADQQWGDRIVYLSRTTDTRLSLNEIVAREDFRNDQVYIISHELEGENPISLKDLTNPQLANLNQALSDKHSTIILTTNRSGKELGVLDVVTIALSADGFDLKSIFYNHLNWYKENKSESSSIPSWYFDVMEPGKLATAFTSPYQVDRFFRILLKEGLQDDIQFILQKKFEGQEIFELDENDQVSVIRDALQRMAHRVGQSLIEPARPWFEHLSENARLYAMLVVLLRGIDRSIIDLIYYKIEQNLRNGGVATLVDARQIGRDDLLEMIHVIERENHQLVFTSPTYLEEVERQIFNRHRLVWELVSLESFVVDQFWENKYIEFQYAFGRAIGHIGALDFPEVAPLLNKFAKDNHWSIVRMAGYAAAEVCYRSPDMIDNVIDFIKVWGRSGDFDFKCAAPLALSNIYLRLNNEVIGESRKPETKTIERHLSRIWDVLESQIIRYEELNEDMLDKAIELVLPPPSDEPNHPRSRRVSNRELQAVFRKLDEWRLTVFSFMIQSIVSVAQEHPKDVVKQVRKWIGKKAHSELWLAGVVVGKNLFEGYSSQKIELQLEVHQPLLDLVEPLLCLDPIYPDVIEQVIRTLSMWVQKDYWTDLVTDAVLGAVRKATPEVNNHIRLQISVFWMNNSSKEVQDQGLKILTTSYFSDGMLLFPENMNWSLLLALDTSRTGKLRGIWDDGCVMHPWLHARIKTHVAQLGFRNELSLNKTLQYEDLKSWSDRPVLAYPLIETVYNQAKIIKENVLAVCILTAMKVEDEEELPYLITKTSENEPPDNSEDFLILGRTGDEKSALLPAEQFWNHHQNFTARTSKFTYQDLFLIDRNTQDFTSKWMISHCWNTTLIGDLSSSLSFEIGYETLPGWFEQKFESDKPKTEREISLLLLLFYQSNPLSALKQLEKHLKDQNSPSFFTARSGLRLLYRTFGQPDLPTSVDRKFILTLIQSTKRFISLANDLGTLQVVTRALMAWASDADFTDAILGKYTVSSDHDEASVPEENSLFMNGSVLPALVQAAIKYDTRWLEELVTDILSPQNPNEETPLEESSAPSPSVIYKRQGLYTVSAEDLREQRNIINPIEAEESYAVIPDSLRKIAQQIQARLAIGKGKIDLLLEKDKKFALLLVDANTEYSDDLAKLCASLVREMPKSQSELANMQPIVFRLGQKPPVTIADQAISIDEIALNSSYHPPLLAFPILEQIGADKIGFVLIFSNRNVIDLEDLETLWGNRAPIFVFSSLRQQESRPGNEETPLPKVVNLLDLQGIKEKSEQEFYKAAAHKFIRTVTSFMKG